MNLDPANSTTRFRFFWLLAGSLFLSIAPTLAKPVVIQDVEGTAWYTFSQQTHLLTLSTSYLDPVVDFLTEGNSSLFVSPFPGSTVRLDQMSQMRVESITSTPLSGGGEHEEAKIDLISGKMTAFAGVKNQRTNLTVTTPLLKLEFQHALCVVCCSTNDTHVYVAKGEVMMTPLKSGVAGAQKLLKEKSGMLSMNADGTSEMVPMQQADPGAKGCLAAGLTQDILDQGIGYAAGTRPFLPIGLGGPPIIIDSQQVVSPTQ